jgi:hypothetical protein
MASKKIDYKKELKQFYGGKAGESVTVDVPELSFIMVDGQGDPNTSQEYVDAIQTLYPLAYTLKFMSKSELQRDFAVMPLEGLWWTENMEEFTDKDKSNWLWTAMIMQPEFITQDMFERAVGQVRTKKNPASLDKARLEKYTEGRSAQVMYVGPYSDEGPTIKKLHAYIEDQGGKLEDSNGHHHEIYFSDPRRVAPEKLKTIIRQPF